jgi:hypothetical protein
MPLSSLVHQISLMLSILLLLSCGSRSSNNDYFPSPNEFDGDYCASVHYYNPNTGTESDYTLHVEIEDDLLTVIHFPNGGWLDDSHFSPPDISTGEASFTSAKGMSMTRDH